MRDIYAFYSIRVDGFDITPPSTPRRASRFRRFDFLSNLFARQTSKASTSTSKAPTSTPSSTVKPAMRAPSPTPTLTTPPTKRQTSYARSNLTMIVDSGASLLYIPDQIADYIASLFNPPARYVPYSGLYITACDAAAPRVGVIIAGTSFFIATDDLMNRSPGAVGGPGVGAQYGECALGVQRAGAGNYVLGDTWLKNVLVAFDSRTAGKPMFRVVAREVYV